MKPSIIKMLKNKMSKKAEKGKKTFNKTRTKNFQFFITIYYFWQRKAFRYKTIYDLASFEKDFPPSVNSNTKIYEILHNTDIYFSLISIIISSLFLLCSGLVNKILKLDRIAECQICNFSLFGERFLVEEFPFNGTIDEDRFSLFPFLCPDEKHCKMFCVKGMLEIIFNSLQFQFSRQFWD